MSVHVMWFRRDLRLSDNAALTRCAERGAVVPVCVEPAAQREPGVSARWREDSLEALDASLRRQRSRLIRLTGDAPSALAALAAGYNVEVVHCSRDWTPTGIAEENAVREALAERGVELAVAEGSYLVAPNEPLTQEGRPYRVFTPFFRAWSRIRSDEPPLEKSRALTAPERWPDSAATTRPVSSDPIHPCWQPGEAGAQKRLAEFVATALAGYATDRDLPAIVGTSELSPHLAFGEISPRHVARAVEAAVEPDVAEPFLRQLAWREFSAHVLHQEPRTVSEPLRREFSAFPWRDDPEAFDAWREGRTGYPLVDAGMRQLATTGWMHNRVRLVCGSFLAKDLLVPWQAGLAHFARTLADHDPASNVFNWQWVAGSGADAAPYFRVFNPVLQGERFDPDGSYVREWVPELAHIPARWIHRPWEAPGAVLDAAGVTVGTEYPHPLIDHAEARERALAAYAAIRSQR